MNSFFLIFLIGSLKLAIAGRRLQCDKKLQWVKVAQVDGTVTWAGKMHVPKCANFPDKDWDEIVLDEGSG